MRSLALASAVGLLSCSGRVSSDTPTEPGMDAARDEQAEEAEPEPGCPSTPPREGDACAYDPSYRYSCSYGSDPIALCRLRFQCMGRLVGGSEVEPRWRRIGADCPEPRDCPSIQPVEGATCDRFSVGCAYRGGVLCFCAGGPALKWACTVPEPGCPAATPNSGTWCEGERSCRYDVSSGRCRLGVQASCTRGVWSWTYGCAE